MSGLKALFGDTVYRNDGTSVAVDSLADNDLIGIYFSAHWCGPCRFFTPQLVEFYHKVNGAGKKFEVIFVSADESQEHFDEYFGEMPWLTIGFTSDKKDFLETKYSVDGIPTLVLVNSKGETAYGDGRELVQNDPEGADFPWEMS